MLESHQLTLLPSVLIAVASVLVDATFRSDVYRDRIWAQIALWLAASLQGVSNDTNVSITNVLIHATFFLSLTSAGYQAFMVQCRWTTSDSIRADYTRFLAPSILLPLIYSWIMFIPPFDMHSAWMQCLALFVVALMSLCGWRWTTLRKRRVRQDLVGMPTVESLPVFSTSTRSLEGRVWMDWTPSEVLTWINSLEGDEWASVCSQLAPERIPGSVLDALTVTELRSMGMPYGPAQCLVDKIHDLTTEYPPSPRARGSRYRDPQQDELEIDEWLRDDRASAKRPQAWAHDAYEEGLPPQTASAPDVPYSSTMFPGELNEEAIQKAKDVFREQFGLELPEIKLRNPVAEQLPSDEAGRYSEDIPATLSQPTTAAGGAVPPENQVGVDFPPDLLDTMPPHVREVAKQRPDLVQMLWKQRQQGKSASPLGLSRIHQLRMQDPAYAERFVGAQAAAEMTGIPLAGDDGHAGSNANEDDMPDPNSDGERTGLLRKRAARPTKYAAIR